jgi:hypothetical protein
VEIGHTAEEVKALLAARGEIQFVQAGQLADIDAILDKDLDALPDIE